MARPLRSSTVRQLLSVERRRRCVFSTCVSWIRRLSFTPCAWMAAMLNSVVGWRRVYGGTDYIGPLVANGFTTANAHANVRHHCAHKDITPGRICDDGGAPKVYEGTSCRSNYALLAVRVRCCARRAVERCSNVCCLSLKGIWRKRATP